ncbi:peptidoglycan recognition protein family protein [Rhizobium laguerreae]|uniref:peptidoglycan recognition protein family protein n=1 Tax=Rhizobium laguerreae TaxID=1076926 RepID=UPI001C9201D0|nr:N-acetylmuramoyl-L-alanine amidase [Rhizobium laguerreae]MBY3198221.1 N-acetylmuramoyl-L-alanine amidase [Rhizobium laguerreae]
MKVRAIGLVCIFLFSPGSNAHADSTGARLRVGNLDIQFIIEDMESDEVRRITFGEGGVVARTAALLVAQSVDALSRTLDLTVHLDSGVNNAVQADLTSATIDLAEQERSIIIERPESLVITVCEALKLQDCDAESAASTDMTVALPKTGISAPKNVEFILLEIGNFPSDDPENQIVVPKDESPETLGGESIKLPAAIDRISRDLYNKSDTEVDFDDGLEAASRREFFVVHCTAFGASDRDMRKWVERNKREGKRNKSHGVILPSGEWLPMWNFDERNVWATKTETCKETKPQAMGSAINIELHYFCGNGRSDRATEAQYTKLAELYFENSVRFGNLAIVSHREMDRGLKDGHGDPIGFDFSRFYDALEKRHLDLRSIERITDARHGLRTGPDISHHWKPTLSGPLVSELTRVDDCKRDH